MSPGGGHSNPLQYSCLENPMDRGAWQAMVHSRIPLKQLSTLRNDCSSASIGGGPFPIKSLALSAHVSPRTIHFRVLDKSPVSGPGRGPPSCKQHYCVDVPSFLLCFDLLLPYLCGIIGTKSILALFAAQQTNKTKR